VRCDQIQLRSRREIN